jgi:hypothetical protein
VPVLVTPLTVRMLACARVCSPRRSCRC